jgi:hypothetical protein
MLVQVAGSTNLRLETSLEVFGSVTSETLSTFTKTSMDYIALDGTVTSAFDYSRLVDVFQIIPSRSQLAFSC